MNTFRPLILAFMCLIIVPSMTGCGFSPVYGKKSLGGDAVPSVLKTVEIASIPDREGQFLRNELIDRFYLDGTPTNPAFTLNVDPIEEVRSELDITVAADTTRAQLKQTTNMRLVDNSTGQTVLRRPIRSISSFNVLGDEYATRVSEKNTRENGLKEIARQIEQQVSLYIGALN